MAAGTTDTIPANLATGTRSDIGVTFKPLLLPPIESDHCNFYDGKLWITPDGRWGWLATVKSFRSHKQWKGSFILLSSQSPEGKLWFSDIKYTFMIDGGNTQYWWEWPIVGDQGVMQNYSLADLAEAAMKVS